MKKITELELRRIIKEEMSRVADATPTTFFHMTRFDTRGQPVDQGAPHWRGELLTSTWPTLQVAIEAASATVRSAKRTEIRVTSNKTARPGEGKLVWEYERPETSMERFDRLARERQASKNRS
jgi:hypothetical protein